MRRGRRSDSDDDDVQDNYSKRDKVDTNTVESLIYRVGSKDTLNIEKDITELAAFILAELPRNSDKILKILTKCVKNIPERMLAYATLTGLINLKNRSVINQLIELLQRELRDAIKSSAFEDAKYIVLFLSASVNCNTVTVNSILSLFENFAEVTLDVGRSTQSRTDWYAYVLLYSLPYSGHMLASHDNLALTDILGTIDVYMTKRQKHHVPLLRVWESDDPHPQEDYLECLWAQIRNLQAADWQEKVTWRIYDSFPSLRELGHPHKLSLLTPPDYDTETVYPTPRVIFRMFDYTDVIDQDDEEVPARGDSETGAVVRPAAKPAERAILPGTHTIERFMIDEQLTILMNNLSFNRTLCARSMLGLRTRARVALDYMIIEAVFAGLFNLPNPPVQHGNLLFYGSLLIQLCQEASNTIPLVLAQATEMLYERLPVMKPVCIGRMIEWFSYHLSNFKLQWSWREWSGAVSEDPMSAHRRLITETLARLIRISYYENVKRLLPKNFYALLPPQPAAINKYDKNPDLPSANAFYQLLEAIRTRRDPKNVLQLAQRAETMSMSPGGSGCPSPIEPEDDAGGSRVEALVERLGDAVDMKQPGSTTTTTRESRRPSDFHSDSESDMATALDVDAEQPPEDEEERVGRRKVQSRKRLVGLRRLPVNKSRGDAEDESTARGGEAELPAADFSHGVTSMSIELFFSALLIAGHKTISHTFAFIKKYSSVIRAIASSVESQVEALHVLQAVWVNHPQMIVIITEHMCSSGLLDPEAIVRWAYSPIMTSLVEIPFCFNPSGARPRILDFYVWECLSRTLVRVGRRVTRATNRLEAAKEDMESDAREMHALDADDLRHRLSKNSRGHNQRRRGRNGRGHHRNRQGKPTAGRRSTGGGALAGCELISSSSCSGSSSSGSDSESSGDEALKAAGDSDYGCDNGGTGGSRVARLEEARCEAVRSQCAVLTLLLHRHARLTAEVALRVANEMGGAVGGAGGDPLQLREHQQLLHSSGQHLELSQETMRHIAFWLKGRLVQVALEHCDQLLPYLDNLDEFICTSHPEVQEVFQQLRALYA